MGNIFNRRQFTQLDMFGPTATPSAPKDEPPAPRQEIRGQLDMVRPVKDIIDKVHKVDSRLYDPKSAHPRNQPRAQWEDPESGHYGRGSLRDEKMEHNDARRDKLWMGTSWGEMFKTGNAPPLGIFSPQVGGPETLADGHHRLAELEARGATEAPISHRDLPQWGSERRAPVDLNWPNMSSQQSYTSGSQVPGATGYRTDPKDPQPKLPRRRTRWRRGSSGGDYNADW